MQLVNGQGHKQKATFHAISTALVLTIVWPESEDFSAKSMRLCSRSHIKAINDVRLHHCLLKPWSPPEQHLFPVWTIC